MATERRLPADPVSFIQDCVRRGRILWTYHVNMRLAGRFIAREAILAAVATYELAEAYPDDNVRVVTSYHPDPGEWRADLKTRRPT